MLNRSVLPLWAVLLLIPSAASAQLRFQPPPPAFRLDARPLTLREPFYPFAIADTVHRQTYWQDGWWTGVAIGAVLGTVFAFGNREGYPNTFAEKVNVSILASAFIGVPLGVIGGLIGDAFKKPVSATPASPLTP